MSGRVSFIGAGPGAADLLTVRGARRIAEADVVVWAANVVSPECVQQHANAHAQLVDSSRLSHEEAIEIYRRAERDGLNVARVHSGDSALWSGIQDQYDACLRMSLTVEMVPGVPTFSAAAAAAGRELTIPEIADSLVLTKLEAGNSALPDNQRVREFAKHGTSMALFLSAARAPHLVAELRAGGYPDDVPVLIAYKVSCPDELILRTTLGDLEQAVKQHRLWRNTLFIVSRALDESSPRPYLYQSGQLQTYRRAQASGRNSGRLTRTRSTSGRAPRSAVRQNAANMAREAGTDETAADTAESADPAAGHVGDATGSKAVPQPRDAAERQPKSWRSESGDERKQSDSDLAWWAVRDWQKAAREASRPGEKRVPAQEESTSESEETASAAAAEVAPSSEELVTPEHQVLSVDSGDSTTESTSGSVLPQAGPETEPRPEVESPEQDQSQASVDGQVKSAAQASAPKTASKTSKASSAKSGSAKSGSAKSGTSRTSAAKSSARSGAAKATSAKSSAGKSGAAKSTGAKTSAAKTSAQSTSAKTSAAKSGAAKSGTGKRATRSSARKSQQALPTDDSGSA